MSTVVFPGTVVERETDRAIYVRLVEGEKLWVPKSIIDDDSEVWRGEQEGELVLPEWWVEKMELADPLDNDPRWRPLRLTPDQRLVVGRAITTVRTASGDPKMDEGRAIELVCADYLAGASGSGTEHWKKVAAEIWAAVDDMLGEGTVQECVEAFHEASKKTDE